MKSEILELHHRANSGDVDAQNELAAKLASGDGVRKNIRQALNWYRKSAKNFSPEGTYNLATMVIFGEGTEKNLKKGKRYLKKAANLGSVDAHLVLADSLLNGHLGYRKNMKRATTHYANAARLGSIRAFHEIGRLLASDELKKNVLSEVFQAMQLGYDCAPEKRIR